MQMIKLWALLLLLGLSCGLQAQELFVPNGSVGNSGNSNVLIGSGITPSSKLFINSYNYNALTLRRSNTAGGGVNIDMINGIGYRWSVLVGSDNKFYIGKQDAVVGDVLTIDTENKVGIGTRYPDAPLTVAGNIHAREIKVTATAGGADFVFAEDYALPKLEEVAAFVKQNKHLPEIPSAAEMEANGLHLAEMNIKLLQKVEELTLYAIEQEKKIQARDELMQQMLLRLEALEKAAK